MYYVVNFFLSTGYVFHYDAEVYVVKLSIILTMMMCRLWCW